jgi:hypothetical protein
VTALYTLWSSGGSLRGSPWLWVGIAGVLLSVIVITMNTPHAAPPAKSTQPEQRASPAH